MLIQVERIEGDQRGSGYIHADDVRDWLLTAGFEEAGIANPVTVIARHRL